MYLRIPVKLSVDGGEPYRLAYNFCVTNSCLAGEVADPRLIREMETGNALALEVVDVNFLSIKTTLPLAQFAMVHKGSPAQTFEQDIDE
jgi:invasion protein IalB